LVTGLDIAKPKDNDFSIHGGLEYSLASAYFLRAGYSITPSNNLDVDGLTNLTGGVGVRLGHFAVDYAFVPFGDLGNTHRISLLINFQQK